ncbi:MAG: roadblock/LC7 domain-containing protein [Chloroflexota bacterium]
MEEHEPTTLRVGITIYPYHEAAIEQVLARLAESCPTHFILLADTSGQLITIHGNRGSIDPTSLASLVAGDLVASKEIARMTGQYQACQLIMREGKDINTFIAEIGRYLALFVQVASNVPLGWARLLILDASQKINTIISTPPPRFNKVDLGLEDVSVSNAVDDALSDLWKT